MVFKYSRVPPTMHSHTAGRQLSPLGIDYEPHTYSGTHSLSDANIHFFCYFKNRFSDKRQVYNIIILDDKSRTHLAVIVTRPRLTPKRGPRP